MSDDSPPYWVLISVLFSSKPLAPQLAMDLYQLAIQLFRRGEGVGKIRADLVDGTVINAKKDLAMGSITGPLFEAELETERGHTSVRFLITKQGLELGPPDEPAAALN